MTREEKNAVLTTLYELSDALRRVPRAGLLSRESTRLWTVGKLIDLTVKDVLEQEVTGD